MSCGKGNIISRQCTNCVISSNQINEVYSMFCACGLRFLYACEPRYQLVQPAKSKEEESWKAE